MDEFKDKMENDPFRSGSVLHEQYPDDVSEMLELLFYAKGIKEITLKISQDNNLFKVEILNRK